MTGIYKIINKVNGKYYVGSSVDGWKRWKQHQKRLNEGKHDNDHLQNAWYKYGKESFYFVMVEKTERNFLSQIEDKYLLIAKEEPDKSYNLNFRARGNGLSEQSKMKLSNSLMGRKLKSKTKEKLSNLFGGINHPGSDKVIYTFENEVTKEIFTGTRYDFCVKFQLSKGDICNLIHGKRNKKHVKHWVLKSSTIKINVGRDDKTVYAFRNLKSNEIFTGIRSDFRKLHPEIHPSNIWWSLKHHQPTRGWNIQKV